MKTLFDRKNQFHRRPITLTFCVCKGWRILFFWLHGFVRLWFCWWPGCNVEFNNVNSMFSMLFTHLQSLTFSLHLLLSGHFFLLSGHFFLPSGHFFLPSGHFFLPSGHFVLQGFRQGGAGAVNEPGSYSPGGFGGGSTANDV